MIDIVKNYDVVVIGAGHAGCEAALASARIGCKTIIFTVSIDSIALMPCNPNIGGTSKGHLVKEVSNNGIFLIEYKEKRIIRQIKLLGNSRALLVSNEGSVRTETVELNNLKVIAKLERIEFNLPS